jgi:superoxide reductase
MTKLRELYKCSICGNVVEVVHTGAPALVCCGQPMEKMEAKTEDTGNEKHVPVVEESEGGIRVTVGSIEHPMEEKHFIQFIEVLTNDQVLRAELHPGQKPQADFSVNTQDIITVREYCNIHGLWKTK